MKPNIRSDLAFRFYEINQDLYVLCKKSHIRVPSSREIGFWAIYSETQVLTLQLLGNRE
jgi:hypothetical protein